MKFREVEGGYLIRFDKGDEVIGTLMDFAQKQNIVGAFIWGIGVVENVALGVLSYEQNQYITKTYRQVFELGSLLGNITIGDDTGQPMVHCHATIFSEQSGGLTGHLFGATVSVTLEMFVKTFKEKLVRQAGDNMEYRFWQL